MGSKSGSVAPKERVKITYKPDTGDAKEERELPMRMLVLGDFSGREDDTPIEERAPINVDKNNFDEVLASQRVSLDIQVPDESAANKDERMNVHLEMQSIKDFAPDAVARQVPQMRELIEMREALVALKAPLINNARFRKSLQKLVDDEDQRKSILDELDIGATDSNE